MPWCKECGRPYLTEWPHVHKRPPTVDERNQRIEERRRETMKAIADPEPSETVTGEP